MKTRDEYFRANVGAVIINGDRKILVFRRTDVSPDSWQMPQGGILRGEDPLAALSRELGEETGLAPGDFEVVDRCPEWLAYELPEAYRSGKTGRGQVQKWFLCRLLADDSRIRPDGDEFDAWRWVSPDDLPREAVAFRKAIYRRVLEAFARHL